MNLAIAITLLVLFALLTLSSYVDRVYAEIGKFLSREFQDNIDAFEQHVEPKLKVSRSRAALSMAVLTPLLMAAVTMSVVPLIVVFVVLQKYLVKGIQLGSVKG